MHSGLVLVGAGLVIDQCSKRIYWTSEALVEPELVSCRQRVVVATLSGSSAEIILVGGDGVQVNDVS